MTDIIATIKKDSISPDGIRLTTFQLRYPRFIHSELMTHRVFSRNARSSRAVPVTTMIREVETNPVIPLHWGKHQKGMQAHEETNAMVDLFGAYEHTREDAWLAARDAAVRIAKAFNEAGYAKQVINRLLEPFMHIDVLVTSTEWSNFFALRDHADAEPHIQLLARAMSAEFARNSPTPLWPGEWHLPYVSDAERTSFDTATCRKLSTARCARISYTPFDGNSSVDAEIARHDALVGATPLHASPTEHQATPDYKSPSTGEWANPKLSGNFRQGWIQYRKMLPGENL